MARSRDFSMERLLVKNPLLFAMAMEGVVDLVERLDEVYQRESKGVFNWRWTV